MKKKGDWAFGPDVRVVDAEQVDGGWLVSAIGDRRSAIGEGDQRCPDCGEHSKSRHSWHNRRLQDLPVQGERMALKLRVGRWRCRNRRCERQTFVAFKMTRGFPWLPVASTVEPSVRPFAKSNVGYFTSPIRATHPNQTYSNCRPTGLAHAHPKLSSGWRRVFTNSDTRRSCGRTC